MANPSILLSGQQPDLMGAFGRGAQIGAGMRDIRNQNALQQLYQQHGAGIARGDESALNALAGVDPQAAIGVMDARQGMDSRSLGMDATRLDMAATRQRMNALTRDEARQAQALAVQMDAAQREQAAAAMESILSGAAYYHAQGDQAGYEQYMAQQGVDPRDPEYAFEQFPATAARTGQVLDIWRDLGRYRPVGGNVWDWNPEGGGAPVPISDGSGQEEIVFGPDGQPIMTRGPVGTGARFTEAQSKDNVYSTRARSALNAFSTDMQSALTSRSGAAAGVLPLGFGKGIQGEDYLVAEQAASDWLLAFLRKDTGAAVTESEQRLYGDTYLPRAGDPPAVIEAKRQARITATNAMEAGMSPAQIVAQHSALARGAAEGGRADPNAPSAERPAPLSPSQNITQDQWEQLWSTMSAEEKAAFGG